MVSLVAFRGYLPYSSSLVSNRQPTVVLQMNNAHFVGLTHGSKSWSLDATKVEIGQQRYITTLADITNGKIFESGKPILQVKAGQATYNSVFGDLLLEKGISVIGNDGQRVTAQGATWNSMTSTLRSKGEVVYQSDWGKAKTDRMLVDVKKQEMTMWNVVVSIKPDKLEAVGDAL